ncbi:hypothetical protein [Mycolicibacterium goodii]|uniref:hypothetical protein n=1 Tax=Mycolicibacterium goodii TaxID=134601 RepID=UPI001BDC98C3|nr:hypothetical protein [Mycolicibacterium goodii]MBU8830808.1 hypothetical protein [Mycolicibacterium goodii]
MAFLMLTVLLLVAEYWPWMVAGVAVAWLVRAAVRGYQAAVREAQRERARARELADRADQQHAWTLTGDQRGVYGLYPPIKE